MSYRSVTQLLFQFGGGFCIAQYTYPLLHKNMQGGGAGAGQGVSATVDIKAQGGVMGGWHLSLGARPEVNRTLSEDVERVLTKYPWPCAAAITSVVVCGGVPAVMGGLASVYLDGEDGKQRYRKVKTWIREFNSA